MSSPTLRKTIAAAVVFAIAIFCQPSSAQAEIHFQKVYKVQVEYWFWDSDYSYWGDHFVTTDANAANWVYWSLLIAKANGNLNGAAPNVNWKYIAIDVRKVVTYRPIYIPTDSLTVPQRIPVP